MLNKLGHLFRNFFRRNSAEQDLHDEVSSYSALLEEEKKQSGLNAEQAQREARMELGGEEQVKEKIRDVSAGVWLETLWQDVKYGLRQLRKNPGFAFVAVLTLALGIGANTTIFSVVNGVLLRPLPYENPEQLVRISSRWTGLGSGGGISGPEYVDYGQQAQSFSAIGIHSSVATMNVAFGKGEPERVPRNRVSSSMFHMLGVKPVIGRLFLPEEDKPGASRVLILSHRLWMRRWGGDESVVGKTVQVQGVNMVIVGVMPPGFAFPTPETEIWHPLGMDFATMNRNGRFLRVIGRMKPGATVAQLQMELNTIGNRLEQTYPVNYPAGSGFGIHVISLQDQIVGPVRPAMLILLGAVAFVLLIACANVANLVLARANAREKELAIRAALGAERGRLVRQALTESVLLSLAGGALGILLAYWGLQLLVAVNPVNIPRLAEVRIDRIVMGFTLGISVLTGLLVGAAAAAQTSRPDLNAALQKGGRGAGRSGNQQLRSLLVVCEVALAAVLLVGAGLLLRGFSRLQNLDPGLKAHGLLGGTVALLDVRYYTNKTLTNQVDYQLLDSMRAIPGVTSAAAISNPPVGGYWDDNSFAIEGRPPAVAGLYPSEEFRVVTENYFHTMGIPLLRGREFNESDLESSPRVVIVSESLARKFWPNEDAIGKRIKDGEYTADVPWMTIVGVVGDVRPTGLTAEVRPMYYQPLRQAPNNVMTYFLRTDGDPNGLIPAMRECVRRMDAGQPIFNVRSMDDLVADSIAQPRFSTSLLGVFALLALTLASVGIYGVLAYLVGQRTQEIGIRVALGAQKRDVLRMVLAPGLRLVSIGLALGVAGGAAASQMLSSLFFGITPFDAPAYAGVTLFLLGVATVAMLLPALRAARVNPLTALRYE